MPATPSYLVLMGSGETSPTMTKTHRELVAEMKTKRAVLLDTPAGFQENVSIVSAKAIEYFKESVNLSVALAPLARATDEGIDPLGFASSISAIDAADWVFAGPGSPTFATRQWTQTAVPALLGSKLATQGVVILASAAACTAGKRCVPVYEIYKCGEEPYWAEGMDLLASEAVGLPGVTVIPHFDNTEGTNHDTRFCYLGERRLLLLEAMMTPGETIIGIDEHTALVIDVRGRTAKVTGNGSVTVRRRGSEGLRISVFPTSSVMTLAELMAEGTVSSPVQAPDVSEQVRDERSASMVPTDPLAVEVALAASSFEAAVETRSAPDATTAILRLDAALGEWGRDQTSTRERYEALQSGATLRRTLIVRLGEFATSGLADPREARSALVELILRLRASARSEKRWDDSDAIRDGLIAAGIEVRDTQNGVEWVLH